MHCPWFLNLLPKLFQPRCLHWLLLVGGGGNETAGTRFADSFKSFTSESSRILWSSKVPPTLGSDVRRLPRMKPPPLATTRRQLSKLTSVEDTQKPRMSPSPTEIGGVTWKVSSPVPFSVTTPVLPITL